MKQGEEMFKNYIFDLYGTLIDINTDEERGELWEKIALLYRYKQAEYSGEQLKNDYRKYVNQEKKVVIREHPEYKFVDIKIENVFEKLFKEKGVRVEETYIDMITTAFRSFSTKYIRLYEGVIDLLDNLKKQGKNIFLLSNAQRVFTINELNMFGLVPYFDGILISSDVQCSKPDANFYNILMDKYKLDKNESIMIGNDWISDIKGGKKVGLKTLYIHQSISPEITGKLEADYSVMDGDVYMIKKFILKQK